MEAVYKPVANKIARSETLVRRSKNTAWPPGPKVCGF